MSTMNNADVLDGIHALLDGQVWDADTPGRIADLLREAGYEVRPYEEECVLDPIPAYGDHMTIEEFRGAVECGAFIPDDGCGSWATGRSYEMGSNVWSDLNNPPSWATHVVWFNR